MAMEQQLHTESEKQIKANRKALERDEKRIAELKRLFSKTYEDNASGKLSDERFEMLSQTYEAEQKELEEEVLRLKRKLEYRKHRFKISKYPFRKQISISVLRNLPHILFMN